MKVALASDLHLEFKDLALTNTVGADVLVLAGDIFVVDDLRRYLAVGTDLETHNTQKVARGFRYFKFLQACSENFKHVVLIMGNHEHYHGNFMTSADVVREAIKSFENIYLLDKQFTVIDNVVFFGGTLWTDFNKNDPITIHHALFGMNDYQVTKTIVQGSYCKFLPADALADHGAYLTELAKVLKVYPTQPTVVVGHHAPSKLSTHERYRHEHHMNGCYSTDLSEIMLDNPQIKLWVHGHTHDPFDYMIGSTRVACNPRGYADVEDQADLFELVTFDV